MRSDSTSTSMGFEPLRGLDGLDELGAFGGPVLAGECGDALACALLHGRAALLLQHGEQRSDGLAHVGHDGHLGGVVLGEVPIDEADLNGLEAVRHGIDLAPYRHADGVGAEHDHQVVLGEDGAHLGLLARQAADVTGAFREEVGAVGDALLHGGRADRFGKLRGFLQRIALDDLIAGDNQRPLGLEDAVGERGERFVGGAHASCRRASRCRGRCRPPCSGYRRGAK